ncbi:MAG: acyltransferase [Thermodesulfobacteriota bacterium]|nr:acyltransferase [Thermodesulfobacteriota bacterium]
MGSAGRSTVITIRAVEDIQVEARATLDLTKGSGRRVAFDYLRAFVVALVLCHHAVLAYTTFAFINLENPIATISPVVNEQRWRGFDLIVAFNETFFMPLLFFVSGMFVWQSLARKGARRYLGRRLTRLGLPFVIGVPFLIPLAYYPAQLEVGLMTGVNTNYGAFWLGMVRSGFGTAGPLWFLWLLLAFNCLATLLYRLAPRPGGLIRGRSAIILGRPVFFFGALLGISTAVYLPITIIFGPLKWIGIGPFHAQASRVLLYLVYFLAGTAVGARGFDRSAFRSDGALAKGWWGWLAVGLMSYIVWVIMVVSAKDQTVVSAIPFMVCCGATVFGMTGLFLRFAKRRVGIFDSLSENAYGIYVVHYVFVTWLQYLLLGSALAPSVKGMMVFVGTLILSWTSVAAMRRIPAVAKVI